MLYNCFRTTVLVILLTLCVGSLSASVGVASQHQSQDLYKASGRERTAAQQRAYISYMDGVVYRTMGNLPRSASAFMRSIKSDRSHYASYYQLAIIAREMYEIGQALQYATVAYRGDSSNRDYADLYGRLLATAGQYPQAEEVYAKLSTDDPSDSESAALWAILLMQIGENSRALEVINSIENQRGIQAELIDSKRQILLAGKRYEEAYSYLEGVCDEISDLEPSIYISFADLAASLHRDSVALVNYNKAISLDPQNVMPMYSLAEYHRLRGHTAKMFESLIPLFESKKFRTRDKISYYSSHIEPLVSSPEGYGKYLSSAARLAVATYRLDTLDYAAIDFYSRYLTRNGLLDEADLLLKSSLDVIEKRLDTLTNTKQSNENRKKERRVARSLRGSKMDVKSPSVDHPNADITSLYNAIISLSHYRKQADTVDHYLDRAERLYPHSGAIGVVRLFISFERGDTIGALDAAHRVISVTSSDSLRAVALGFCGDMEQIRGSTKRAFGYYDKALRSDPNNLMVLNNYAYFMSLEEYDLDRALAMSQRVNSLSVSNPTYLDTQAWILHKMGRNEEAQTIIRQAIALQSVDNPELLMHYGDILYALGKTFLAKSYWERALAAGADQQQINDRLSRLEPTP